MSRVISILGSTGSIGRQTLDVCDKLKIRVAALTAQASIQRMEEQCRKYRPQLAVLYKKEAAEELKVRLADMNITVMSGMEGLLAAAQLDGSDTVVTAVSGMIGLRPTLAAIEKGKKVALANKESLVVGGELVMRKALEHHAPIVPIDSEHSAIFQCLIGEASPLRRLIITCSGGSLRDLLREALADVTPEQALRHPQWSMGAKITIDSSTLVNKGFEVIEAHWLFGCDADRISVIQHPQSIVHSMVEFEDGAIKAQLGSPDMHTPISFALMYPHRAVRHAEPFSFADHPSLTFCEVDREKYPALDIAYDCMRRGGSAACTMNGANEVAVAAFLNHRCGYLDIVRSIEYALSHAVFVAHPAVEEYAACDREARALATEALNL